MNAPRQFPIARESAGVAPLRRPGSIRRTTTIDTSWPDGVAAPRTMVGLARDLLTPASGEPEVLAEGSFRLTVSPRREILDLAASPAHPRIGELVGVQAGKPGRSSRAQIAEILDDIRGTPLFQLMDDYSGSSLVAVWGWMRWDPGHRLIHTPSSPAPQMVDICIGHAAGSSSIKENGSSHFENQSSAPVGPLDNPDDPAGWHALPPATSGPGHRRARRIDLWREGDRIRVDAGFQDSAPMQDGSRLAVHEYRVEAEIDAAGIVRAIRADPLVLPYAECPGSVLHVGRLIGQSAASLREFVPVELARTLGCTHLNDVLRALADVPVLAARLPA